MLGIGNRLVDSAEVIELHEAIKGKLPSLVQFDQLRDKMLRHSVALDYAEGFPSFRQRVRSTLAGKKRHNAMRIQHVNGELVHLGVASGFYHVIDATAGDLGNAGGDVLTATIDRVGGAQLQGEFEPIRSNVDTDDRAGAHDAIRHDSGYADHSRTENGNAYPAGNFKRVHDSAGSGLQATTQGR